MGDWGSTVSSSRRTLAPTAKGLWLDGTAESRADAGYKKEGPGPHPDMKKGGSKDLETKKYYYKSRIIIPSLLSKYRCYTAPLIKNTWKRLFVS